jgi:hypothetical protein
MAEDIGDFEAEIRAATAARVPSYCTVCHWLEAREDAARWDRILAGPVQVYGHKAIWASMKTRGFVSESSKPIESHRQKQHRVG